MARTQHVTILFCDLVASTERRARLGDDAFDEFTERFMAALRAAISQQQGREVSSAGDGMMVVFPDSVVDAVACAIDMHPAVAALDPHDPPQLRIGISSGEVARDSSGATIPAEDSNGLIVQPVVRGAILLELASMFRFREGEGKDNEVAQWHGYGYVLNKASTALLAPLRKSTVA